MVGYRSKKFSCSTSNGVCTAGWMDIGSWQITFVCVCVCDVHVSGCAPGMHLGWMYNRLTDKRFCSETAVKSSSVFLLLMGVL